jgi:ATP-dependent helicase/nuclease subunit A
MVEYAHAFAQFHGIESEADQARFLTIVARPKGVILNRWAFSTEATRSLRDKKVPAVDAIVRVALRHWHAYLYGFAARFVDDAQDFYRQLRLNEGLLTFHDLLMRTVSLLKNRSDVRSFLQRSYSTLFVDEFQDTDPLQAEILFLLTADDPRQTVWQKAVPRPGSLFIVGDAKQSIYRFRRADVQVFELCRKKLEATGAATARLQTSFRTLGALIDWINPAFQALFPEVATHSQSGYYELLKVRDQGPDSLSVRKIEVRKTGTNSYAAAEQDSERIAAFIAAALEGRSEFNGPDGSALLGERASPGDFMVLTRNTTRLHTYARALEKRGIPFDLVGGGRLGQSRELHALVQLMEVVRDPENAVATLSHLRGPLVGLDDNELIQIRSAGLEFNYKTDRPDVVSDPLKQRLSDAYETIRSAERELYQRTPAAAFDRLLADTGILEFATSDDSGSASSRAGCLVRATAFVKQWESRGMSWIEVLQELRTLIDDTGSKIQEMTLEAGLGDVVQVMNLHQAKGLEAPVVFLADPLDRGGSGKEPEFHVLRDESSGDSVVIPAGRERQFKSEPVAIPADWEQHKAAELEMLAAEEVRLLYVAATRAKNLLVVSRHHSRDTGPWRHIRQALDGVPELEHPAEVDRKMPAPMPDDIDDAVERLPSRWKVSKAPSLAVRPVTGDDEVDALRLQGVGRGRDYGAAVHRLLEELIEDRLGRDVNQYSALLFAELGIEPAFIDDAVAAVEGFRQSAVWIQMQSAERKFTEVGVAVPEVKDGAVSTIIRGRMDLIYETPAGWHIIDFKTDEASTEADVSAIAHRYGNQVRAYAQSWMHATGTRVAEAGLWLTSLNRHVTISDG